MKSALYLASGALLASVSWNAFSNDTNQGYYRDPNLHNDQLVFVAEGDLWRVPISGGDAVRLTTHDAEEHSPHISPDGTQIAFVANYEGAPEAYVMPLQGGIPRRVSFENSQVRVQGWTQSGDVIYSTDSAVGPANHWVLKTVQPQSLERSVIPLADAIEGVFDGADESLYFVRFGLQATGDNTRIYRGGAMGELWRFQTGDEEASRLTTDHVGSVREPMLSDTSLYFISDADGTPNLWSMLPSGEEAEQLTQYNDWQVWSASYHSSRIAYQLGADIKLYDIETGTSEVVDIALTSDFGQRQERWLDDPLEYHTATHYSAASERVVLTARSQLAALGKSSQRLVNIATPVGSRSREAVLSHDGEWVYAINDHSGENEIWRFPADGSAGATQLTDNGSTFRWQLALSPDGKYLAHDDKNGDLWLLNLENGGNERIATNAWGHRPYQDIHWSADSQLLAFTHSHAEGSRPRIMLHSLRDERTETLTSDKYESFAPAFSRDGHWLYFLSNRHYTSSPSSPWGDRNLGPGFDKRTQIFAVSLKAQSCFPFEPAREVKQCDNDAAEAERTQRRPRLVDWEGLSARLWEVPVANDNYDNLSVSDEFLYVTQRDAGSSNATLRSIAISDEKPEVKTFADKVSEYQLGNDGKTLFLRQDKAMFIFDTAPEAPADTASARIDASRWQLAIDPVAEWRQMFHDAWLMHRDFLFDSDMRGLNWAETRQKYEPLLARLTDRHELDDILAQMMGELSVLHSQVRGGEYQQPANRASASSLGATLSSTGNGVRIEHIYRTDPELPSQAAPLAKPGVNAQPGDVITALNGRRIESLAELHNTLRNQAGEQVLLTLERGRQQLETMVEPVSLQVDHRLRYEDWVQHNREQVQDASDSQFGYLHLYAMGAGDIASFAREFYANVKRDGIIIDVRRNRGGNIDSWIIDELLSTAWAFWEPNTHGAPYTNMQQAFRGHLVVLTDQLTYSDGETFAAGIKALDIAPIVGKRTTGAGVWLSGRNRLADGGLARVAETAQFAMDGRWVIEGYGVEPDVEVDNLPHATFNGHDAQLRHAIDLLQRRLKNEPVPPLRSQPLLAPIADDIQP
ncbi:S41 family peptidase [Aliidiomarina sp. Khilg15.8]